MFVMRAEIATIVGHEPWCRMTHIERNIPHCLVNPCDIDGHGSCLRSLVCCVISISSVSAKEQKNST